MYVYEQFNPRDNVWTVGHYDPSGKWHPESDQPSPEEAAARVHYLNGGVRHDDSDGLSKRSKAAKF